MSKKVYTVLVVPEGSSRVRRFQIPHRFVMRGALLVLSLIALTSFLVVHYFHVLDRASENRGLKETNIQLKERLRIAQEELARIDGTLQRIDKFSSKVRAITRLNDPERNLAIGPLADPIDAGNREVMYAQGERIDYEDELADSNLAMRLIDSKLETVQANSQEQESSMRELHDYFSANEALLASTPSIRPVGSKLLNSTFGMRKDPYTGQMVMHKGVDYAADLGSDVLATADGVVVFAGNRGKYGKTLVIDHGFGLQTHFAHLSNFRVEMGDAVSRGQAIGAAGNTGLTTGVHLHYEVRYGGIPQDPEQYILD